MPRISSAPNLTWDAPLLPQSDVHTIAILGGWSGDHSASMRHGSAHHEGFPGAPFHFQIYSSGKILSVLPLESIVMEKDRGHVLVWVNGFWRAHPRLLCLTEGQIDGMAHLLVHLERHFGRKLGRSIWGDHGPNFYPSDFWGPVLQRAQRMKLL